jgi:signal transduction histidine kinase
MNHSMHPSLDSADAGGGGLLEALTDLFTGAWYMPHGHCYLWQPGLVWLHVVSDTLIGAAYFLISLVLYVLVRRIRLPFDTMIIAFGTFIGACGVTHFIAVWNVWFSAYWLSGGVKALTAVASVATSVFLVRLRPTVVEVANAAQLSEQRRSELEEKNRELEALYARLREADELKTQFFSNVSHELRTPLALILGPVERLLGQQALPADSRHDLEVVERNARLLLKHVNALLDVSKLEAGAMRPSYAEVDLAALVRRVTSNFEVLAREHHVTLAVEAPGVLPAQVDPEKLERVLLNLLSNAFKFTPRGGQVRCALRAHGEVARLVVEDTGPGIPEDQRERVFERFRQLEGGVDRPRGGTGLGLAISRDFVRLHGGRLWAEAAAGGGACFVAELPLAAPAGTRVEPGFQHSTWVAEVEARVATEVARAEIRAARVAGNVDPRAPLVLVVEDTADLRHFVAETLGREFRVVEAEDGLAGLREAEALRPDVIVTDIMMPRMGGDALVREVRARPELEAIPILLLSARADDELRVRLLREGAQDYLVKPFLAPELTARVRNLSLLKRTRDVLRTELEAHSEDLEAMAHELALRMRQLEAALTAAEAARAEAERGGEFKSTLLRLVAHELRTPLSALRLDVHLLRRQRETLSETHLRLLDKLERGSLRLEHLIESVIAYSHLEAGELTVRLEEVDVAALAREVVEQQRPQAQRQLLALELRAPDTVPVRTDTRVVQLILTQLVLNALKYTQRGTVEVRVEPLEGGCQLAVADTGRGIPPESQARIFEPFEQLETVERKSTAGLGLGLPLVRQLTEALGGRVQVESVPGQGSTFTVILPASSPGQG